jgi:hypothetical protein
MGNLDLSTNVRGGPLDIRFVNSTGGCAWDHWTYATFEYLLVNT